VTDRTPRLRGVGIDIVSRSRVKQFLARHRDMIVRRFLNAAERRRLKTISVTALAELFTSKEAFFKACGEAWMGIEGFQAMRITKRDGDCFKMTWKPACSKKRFEGEGCFFHGGDLIGAQAIVWR